jgi:hypothetical protein
MSPQFADQLAYLAISSPRCLVSHLADLPILQDLKLGFLPQEYFQILLVRAHSASWDL